MSNCKKIISYEYDYDAIHDFSLWMRTGSNPADINRFRSNTEKNNFIIIFSLSSFFKERRLFP